MTDCVCVGRRRGPGCHQQEPPGIRDGNFAVLTEIPGFTQSVRPRLLKAWRDPREVPGLLLNEGIEDFRYGAKCIKDMHLAWQTLNDPAADAPQWNALDPGIHAAHISHEAPPTPPKTKPEKHSAASSTPACATSNRNSSPTRSTTSKRPTSPARQRLSTPSAASKSTTTSPHTPTTNAAPTKPAAEPSYAKPDAQRRDSIAHTE